MSNELSAARIRALKDAVWAECEAFECTDDEARRMLSAIDSVKCVAPPAADSTPAADVPEGWKLVPIEPTDDMIMATRGGMSEASWMDYAKKRHAKLYSQMLAAAPASAQPPVALTEDTVKQIGLRYGTPYEDRIVFYDDNFTLFAEALCLAVEDKQPPVAVLTQEHREAIKYACQAMELNLFSADKTTPAHITILRSLLSTGEAQS